MPHIDEFLAPLKDGSWHNVEELRNKVKVSEEKFSEALDFLVKYDLVELDGQRVKASQSAMPIIEEQYPATLEEEQQVGEARAPLEFRPSALVVRGKIGAVKMVQGELSVSGNELVAEWSPSLSSEEIALTMLRVLLDGEWHSYEGIASELSMTQDEVMIGLNALADHDLVALSKSLSRAKLRFPVAQKIVA